ncbi:MAG: T9SS type A sorting domain-containing protein, partial [Bacteroidia bacterium]
MAARRPILEEAAAHKSAAPKTLIKPQQAPVTSAKTASSSAVNCTYFTGSANCFGFYQGGHEALGYNAELNAISFTHRAAQNYSTVPNGNTGTIVNKWSVNNGSTWDSTVIWANTVDLGRYPQGGLYNPPGNTNINNAYAVGMGVAVVSGFDGSWWASKKLTTPGTMTAGTDQQFFSNVAPFATLGKKVDFPRYGYTYTKDGLVRALGEVCDDINATTAPNFEGPRGAAVVKGTFNAGAMVWSYDSLIPPTILRSNGSKQMTFDLADMAWNDAGTVGYVMMIGARAATTGAMKGYQPMVYKTTTSGATWTLMPAQDFTNPLCFRGLVDRLWPVNSGTLIVPSFNPAEGIDMAVDANDNLHIATTVVGSYSTNNDSLEYTSNFGTEQYSWPYGSFGFPTIYDFYTVTGGGWRMNIVDSMTSEGTSGTSGYPGYSYNQWASAAIGIDARIQIAHSPDRTKLFYSWGNTDTNVTLGLKWNSFPDLMMRGYDINTNKFTPEVNVTGNVFNAPNTADKTAYFHYMANRTIVTNSATATNEIPFTISYNSTNDGNVEMNHYYLKGASFSQSDFTINPLISSACVVGINSPAKDTHGFDAVCFPNPANGSATIAITLDAAKTADITIYNMVGAQVYNTQIKGNAGTNNVTVDLSSLSRGIYMYTVKVGNANISKKLIVE